ncbi:MAG: hypothetical protein ACRDSP_11165 [Pseudonocardiaceae bacterium]
MAGASGFHQAVVQLDGVDQQQKGLRAAVDAGQLWMEAGVAEAAAKRCDQAIDEIDGWLQDARPLAQTCEFGDNKDGNAAAQRFFDAGREYVATVRQAQQVFRHMADTFRTAGRTAAEADSASEQQFKGRSE